VPQFKQNIDRADQPGVMTGGPLTNDISISAEQNRKDYDRIAAAIRYLICHRMDQPELSDVARAIGLSEYHFQRLFTRWAGISPKKFLQFLTLQHARAALDRSSSVLDAAFDAGLSGPGRLHDLFINMQAVSPGEYKRKGAGMTFRYAVHATRFGQCLAVETDRGLTGLSFIDSNGIDTALAEQQAGWDRGIWQADPTAGQQAIAQCLSLGDGQPVDGPVSLLLRGSAFQIQVWHALLKVPSGVTATYAALSEKAGFGRQAARAFGNACAANRIGVLIPCHRIIRDTGVISGYRWGVERKHALLAYEAARYPESFSGVAE